MKLRFPVPRFFLVGVLPGSYRVPLSASRCRRCTGWSWRRCRPERTPADIRPRIRTAPIRPGGWTPAARSPTKNPSRWSLLSFRYKQNYSLVGTLGPHAVYWTAEVCREPGEQYRGKSCFHRILWCESVARYAAAKCLKENVWNWKMNHNQNISVNLFNP